MYQRKNYANSPLIFHIDVNSAFLSWTAVDLLNKNPKRIDLRTIPSAIGGDINSRHGIISARSIPAKKYGIQSGESVVNALKKCPSLVVVPTNFELYKHYSKLFIDILRSYTPYVQQVSIDEAYCDFTDLYDMYKDLVKDNLTYPLSLAHEIKDTIYSKLGFTVNVGISTNKLLAKMASDFTKPNRVHTLFEEEISQKMWPLPINELHGCGKSTSLKLTSLGIKTIGDAAHTDLEVLCSILGEKHGNYIYYSSNGINTSAVSSSKRIAKSYSSERTMPSNLTIDNYDSDIQNIIQHLSQNISRRMIKDNAYASTIGITLKTNHFKTHSTQTSLLISTNDSNVIYSTAIDLVNKELLGESGLFMKGDTIRLVGIFATNLDNDDYRQLSLFDLF
ncbi:Y-family DNA polymerase [Lachnobacterium bovis]|uniref:Y-family DNA polymerase n=1 Tax=Lachnobacterium bovis TaxID=140626 RepID=UPI0003B535D7|nr:DNA polymerase IV [Lachnobacterium bovis]